jgi:hypothetical protein
LDLSGKWHKLAANHDIHYIYSDDGGNTWKNNGGSTVAVLSNGDPVRVDDNGIVAVALPCNSWIINADAMVVDSLNQPHVLTQVAVNGPCESCQNIQYIHYWRKTDGTWQSGVILDTDVSFPANRARGALAADQFDNLYFFAIENGMFKNWKSFASENWQTWTETEMFTGYKGEGHRMICVDGKMTGSCHSL